MTLLLAAALLALCACGGTASSTDGSAPAAPVAQPGQASSAPEPWSYVIRNQTGVSDVTNLRSTFAGMEAWSDDLLAGQPLLYDEEIDVSTTDEQLGYDFSFSLSREEYEEYLARDVEVLPDCSVDIVIGQDGPAIQVFYDASEYKYYVAEGVGQSAGETIGLLLTNHSMGVLDEVNIARDTAQDWGENLLAAPMENDEGLSCVVSGYRAGALYDIRAVDAFGVEHHIWDVELEDQCELQIALGQGGLGALVHYAGGGNAYWMADTNEDYVE